MKLIILGLILAIIIVICLIRDIERFEIRKYNIWMWWTIKKKYPSGGLGNILSVFFNSMIFNYHIKNNSLILCL